MIACIKQLQFCVVFKIKFYTMIQIKQGDTMKKLVLAFFMLSGLVYGASEASFPKDFAGYKSIDTLLSKDVGALPGCDANVSAFPPIYRETVATYCAVKPGGPGKVSVKVKPSAVGSFKARGKNHKDGEVFILHLEDLKLLFVTEYEGNKPLYGIWTEGGVDAAGAAGSGLNPNDCRTCHTGYAAFCLNGQCGTAK